MAMLSRKAMMAASGVPEFSPTDIEGLQLWLKADAGLYQDTGGTTLATNDGDPVGLWRDQSGIGNNAAQGTAGSRPALKHSILNGMPVVRFTNTLNHYLRTAAFSSALVQPNTIFVVCSVTNTSGQRYIFDGITSGERNSLRMSSAHQIAAYAGTDVNLIYYESASSLPHAIFTVQFNGLSSILRKNGAATDYGNSGTNALGGLTLGTDHSLSTSVYLSGDIAEVIVYNAAMSDTQVALVEAYLAERYGLLLATALLPANPSTSNAVSPLITPTYDGSGEAVHPDVYDAGEGSTWNGYRYWMGVTPYTNTNNAVENPSILASANGDTWEVPAGVTNPLEAYPGAGNYNSDPELVYNDGTLYLFFRQSLSAAPATDTLYCYSSSDGSTWGDRTNVLSGGISTLATPSIVHNGSEWVMWTMVGGSTNTMQRRTSANVTSGWSVAQNCVVYNIPAGKALWHHDMRWTGSEYHAFIMVCDNGTSGSGGVLYFATSSDGINWYLASEPLLSPGGVGAWDSNLIYRSCGVPITGGYDLWYSALDNSNNWRIGRTTVAL